MDESYEELGQKCGNFLKGVVKGIIVPFQGLVTTGNYVDITSPNNGQTVHIGAGPGAFSVKGTIKPKSLATAIMMKAWLEDAQGKPVAQGTWAGVTSTGVWTFTFTAVAGTVGHWLTLNVTAKDPVANPPISLGNSLSIILVQP